VSGIAFPSDRDSDNYRDRERNSGFLMPFSGQSQLRGSFRITRNSLVHHALRRDTDVVYVKEQIRKYEIGNLKSEKNPFLQFQISYLT
jgi:hypothetical protein